MSSDLIQAAINAAAWKLAEARENALREAARERLPRPLRWAVARPRALKMIYRVRPTWRPTIQYGVDGNGAVACVRREDGTITVIEQFRIA